MIAVLVARTSNKCQALGRLVATAPCFVREMHLYTDRKKKTIELPVFHVWFSSVLFAKHISAYAFYDEDLRSKNKTTCQYNRISECKLIFEREARERRWIVTAHVAY